MSTIVKIRNKSTGLLYAYEQTAKWDPVKGQSRPTRKYLGRVDEETGMIIPSTGKRGRQKVKEDSPNLDPAEALINLRNRIDDLNKKLEACQSELTAARAENERLRSTLLQAVQISRNTLDAFESLTQSV